MSQGMITLLAGALLAVASLAFVLYPLFFGVQERPRRPQLPTEADDSAILALREIEFDRATGKLSDADYQELKRSYSARALRELREKDAAGQVDPGAASLAPAPSDPIEARVREYRRTHRDCPTCGVRPEADAVYCSTCGSYLDRKCPECAADIAEPAASFCSRCGTTLARATAFSA